MSTTSTFTAGVICDAVDEVLFGCAVKLIDKVVATLMVKEAVADCCGELESATLAVKEYVPIDDSNPLIMPAALSVIPGGRCPLASDHAIGALPPVEVKARLYGAPNSASGNAPLGVEITNSVALRTLTLIVIVCAGELPSPAAIVKLKLPTSKPKPPRGAAKAS